MMSKGRHGATKKKNPKNATPKKTKEMIKQNKDDYKKKKRERSVVAKMKKFWKEKNAAK